MPPRRNNPKRSIRADCPPGERERWAASISYVGSPYHKRNPGDFGLTPPAAPRPDKTLCDEVEIFKRQAALGLLREGVRRGLVSDDLRGGFPQNIWSVTNSGIPMEAQLENQGIGEYHGYPVLESDDFREEVLRRWKEAR